MTVVDSLLKFYFLIGIPIAGEACLLGSLVDTPVATTAVNETSVVFSNSIYSISALSNGPLGLKLIALQLVYAL